MSREGSDTWRVKVVGELDLATAPRLTEILRNALRGARLVVLDLSELTFLDSAGAHAIVNATVDARAAGRQLLVAHAADRIERVFALTCTSESLERFAPAPGQPYLPSSTQPSQQSVAQG